MNVNKKFARLQQWGKEKMGSDAKTGASDDARALELEMNMRHDGVTQMHSSMNAYVKSLNKRSEGDGREKHTAIGYLGHTMSRHGEQFEDGNQFGECLMTIGQANERIARFQDSYASNATGNWLETLERSLAQMKEYQNARKKLETRRLGYDTSLGKMQKAKSGDYRAEEELRSQKIKYEESAEDVQRRMQDIIEAEQENTQQLYAFLEAEMTYHDRCREVLMQAWKNWPAVVDPAATSRPPRSRANTNPLSRVSTNNSAVDDDSDLAPPLPPFRGGARATSGSSTPLHGSPLREAPGFDFNTRPTSSRQNTATTDQVSRARLGSIDPSVLRSATPLRPTKTRQFSGAQNDIFGDQAEEYASDALTRSSSPATSQGGMSRSTSYSTLDSAPIGGATKKKAPPPPPPSRSTKPPPPPPPMKRSALSSSVVPTL